MKAIDQTTASRRAVLAGLAAAPVVALPDIAGAVPTGPTPSPELIALFEEFQALHPAFLVEFENDVEDGPCFNRLYELANRIRSTPAASLADILIKLRIYRQWEMGETTDLELWEMHDDDRRYRGDVDRTLLSLARDIHRLAGRPDPWA